MLARKLNLRNRNSKEIKNDETDTRKNLNNPHKVDEKKDEKCSTYILVHRSELFFPFSWMTSLFLSIIVPLSLTQHNIRIKYIFRTHKTRKKKMNVDQEVFKFL